MRNWLEVRHMPESLNIHEPVLVNTIGHSVGIVVFGILLVLLLSDTWARKLQIPLLAVSAAFLAFVWNIGSLIALSPWVSGTTTSDVAAAISFGCLSMLPAVLFALSFRGPAALRTIGWSAGAAAVLLHIAEPFLPNLQLHRLALLLIAVVFVVLALISVWQVHGSTERRRLVSGVLAPVALILFAGSFVHFGNAPGGQPWSEEIALHHAGIPLALFIVLQDYRFLMMDAFVRVLASSALAAAITVTCLTVNQRWRLLERSASDPFLAGLLVTLACGGLVLFAFLRGLLQTWVTRRVFRRPSLKGAIARLIERPASGEEADFVEDAARIMSGHVSAERLEVRRQAGSARVLLLPQVVTYADGVLPHSDAWVNVVVPLQFSRGDSVLLLLGRRSGGRRYFSEDLGDLSQLALVAASQVERFRLERAEHLATRAELRALHAQINPHFLFNSLNALYGSIPRQAGDARRMVLNLAEIFRYFLHAERSTIPLAEELRIVKAYLEIEQLRLGNRLHVEIHVDPGTADIAVPALCIQPIVENAIKHGVAAKPGPGRVRLTVEIAGGHAQVSVHDTGDGFRLDPPTKGTGVGLENVRQRLLIMYGPQSDLVIRTGSAGATVGFQVPLAMSLGSDAVHSPAQSAR